MKTKAVLVTGASTGIGKACTLRLDAMGYAVFAGVRRESDAQVLAEAASDRLTPVMLDVTDARAIEDAAILIADRVGRAGLHALVNNAGIPVIGPMEHVPVEDLRRQFEVNVFGQVAVTQAMAPLLRQATGRIVNISSISGRVALPFCGPYAASKFALEAISDSLRLELGLFGISVSLIEPGSIATPIWDKVDSDVDQMGRKLAPPAREHYETAMAAARNRLKESARNAVSVDLVVDTVIHALTAQKPRVRYVVGRSARLTAFLKRVLPDSVFDSIIRRRMFSRPAVVHMPAQAARARRLEPCPVTETAQTPARTK